MVRELLLSVTPMAFLALGLNEQFHEDPDWPAKDSAQRPSDPNSAQNKEPRQDPLSGYAPLQEVAPEPPPFAPLQPGSLAPESQSRGGFGGGPVPQWISNAPREPETAAPAFKTPSADLPEYPLSDNDPRWKQMNALNHAVEMGVLTEAEGAIRRRTILATPPPPPPPDPETVRRKRAAILSALDAEIISREEAAAKLSALPQIPDPAPAFDSPELKPGRFDDFDPPAGVEPRRTEDAFALMRSDQAEPQPEPYIAAPQQPPAPPADEAANARAVAADALRSAAHTAKDVLGSVWHAASSTAHQAADKARDAASSSQWQQPSEPDPYAAAATAAAAPRVAAPAATHQAPPPVHGPAEAGDARGRFRLQLPAGWTAQDEAGTLRLTFGDAWAIFETSSEPGRPVDVAQRHAEKMRPFYSNWKIINGGPFTTKRQRQAGGWTITASWASNSGQREAVLLVWSVNAGGDRFLTMTSSADSAVAQTSNAALMGIFDSVRFAGE